MKPKAVPLEDQSSVKWIVESIYPAPKYEKKFGTYMCTAFVHKDTPTKSLFATNPEAFAGHMDRWDEVPTFSSSADALACAKYLRENARVRVGWDGPEDWRKNYRGEIVTRVVLVCTRKTKHLVMEN